jgi:Fic family protein
MSDTKNLIQEIETQKTALQKLRPISQENMQKIRQKFLLEYNYHSNHIEGNSLTIQETYSMLMNSFSPRESKPLRDIDELRGHIKTVDALGLLEDVVKDEKEITESLIRDLNRMILVENFKKRRQDENGDDMFVDIVVGQYKTKPNSVMTQTGEMFQFASPSETPSLIADLVTWYNKAKDVLHPLELAAIFHYKFIRIHPFDDGNGRVARLLMNLILQQNGFPIVIISSEEQPKKEYYDALMQTDANLIDLHDAIESEEVEKFLPFVEYIGERLLKSLDWTIRGAQGEDIFEVDDIVKESKLFNANSNNNSESAIISLAQTKEEERVEDFLSQTLQPVFLYFDQLLANYLNHYFRSLFLEIFNDGRLVDTTTQINSKRFTTNILDGHEILTNQDTLSFIKLIIEHLKIERLSDSFLENINSPHTIQVNITPVENYGNKVISLIKCKIQFNKMKWRFVIVADDFITTSGILYYKTTPNTDYKKAIKEPLKALSEYLKSKLS